MPLARWSLLPFFASMARSRIARGHLLPILALGIGQFAVLVALLNAGLQSVPAAQGGVIFATFPLVTILLAAALGREQLTLLRGAGAVLSVLGVAICLGVSELQGSASGALLIFAAACVGAVCSVFYRPYLQRYPTLQIGTLAMIAAAISLAPAALTEMPLADMAGLGTTGWLLVLFIGLASGAGYLLWLTALKHTSAGEATVLMGLSPITAASVGALAPFGACRAVVSHRSGDCACGHHSCGSEPRVGSCNCANPSLNREPCRLSSVG